LHHKKYNANIKITITKGGIQMVVKKKKPAKKKVAKKKVAKKKVAKKTVAKKKVAKKKKK